MFGSPECFGHIVSVTLCQAQKTVRVPCHQRRSSVENLLKQLIETVDLNSIAGSVLGVVF